MKINKLAVILSVVTAVSVLCSCTTSDKGNTESQPDTKNIVMDSSAEESSKAPAESSAEEISTEPIEHEFSSETTSGILIGEMFEKLESNKEEHHLEYGYILSSDLSEITPDMTYGDIFEKIGYGVMGFSHAHFGREQPRLYILDYDKLLVLKCNNANDVCGKTGQELAKEAVSRTAPEYARDKVVNGKEKHPLLPEDAGDKVVNGSWYYGILIDEHTFYTEADGYPEELEVGVSYFESITYADGSKADAKDLFKDKQCVPVLLEIDIIAESWPGQAHVKSAVIL